MYLCAQNVSKGGLSLKINTFHIYLYFIAIVLLK